MNAPRTLWVVVDKDGGGDANMHRPTERSAILLAKEWDVKYPEDAPHRVVAYSPRDDRVTDLEEFAWGIIANAGGGNWKLETKDWQGAAARWRTQYHAKLDAAPAVPQGASVPREPTTAMLTAAGRIIWTPDLDEAALDAEIWRAMYDAAPSPATGETKP